MEELELKQGVDVVISFDTTGSVYSVLAAVRREITSLVSSLMEQVYGLRVGIIAHGDYCDRSTSYTIKALDLTDKTHMADIVQFVNKVVPTYGGDSDECYELVLHTAREDFNWRENSQKMLIVIGDSKPHKVGYICDGMIEPNSISWEEEVQKLADDGVQVYAVHALAEYRREAKGFYTRIAEITGGVYLTLNNFSEITHLIKASIYRGFSIEKLNNYVSIIRNSGHMSRDMAKNIASMNGVSYEIETATELEGLVPVRAGRFQTLDVNDDITINAFVEGNGIKFKAGKAYYELSKREKVAQYKDIILQDKKTGEFYEGTDVRKLLGLKEYNANRNGSLKETVKPSLDSYRVFIQSTSYNRKLIEGTKMLYEIDMI